MSDTIDSAAASFRERANRFLSGFSFTRGESFSLAIEAAFFKSVVRDRMTKIITMEFIERVEAALVKLDEPKVEQRREWN